MSVIGHVAAIHRYPVKSLAGETLQSVEIAAGGIPGDRAGALFVTSDHARAGKTFRGKEHNLLHLTSDPAQAIALADRANVGVELRTGSHFFDAAPVSIVFDTWVDEVSRGLGRALDYRRWRPNFFVRAAGGFDLLEDDLPGSQIEMGTAILRVRKAIQRCVTPTYDVATGTPSPEVLRYVAQERGNCFGVYGDVELAGAVRTGDALRLRAR
jgi:uncharacterized protein YcbX